MQRDRVFVLIAMVCAVWTLVNTWEIRPAVFVIPALTFAGIVALARRPESAGWFLVVLLFAYPLLGVHVSNGSFLVPTLTAVYVIGRTVGPWRGLGITAGFLAAMLVDQPTPENAAFGFMLFGGIWLFGHAIARRTRAATIAGAEQARLESDDERATVERVVSQERARIAVDTIAVVREAVDDMLATARTARSTLDPVLLAGIVDRGGRAVIELRHLLGLLRVEPASTPDPMPPRSSRRTRGADVGGALIAAVLVGIDSAWMRGTPGWTSIALALIQCSALMWRRTNVSLAVGIAFGVLAASQLLGIGLWDGFGGLFVYSVLAWSVGSSPARSPWLLFAAYLTLMFTTTWRGDPDSLVFACIFTLIPLLAGRAWSERDREFERSRTETAALLHRRNTIIAEAVATERLVIARELHDVSSHTVGVMVLQTQAALAQRATDPDRAREALAVVETAGEQAVTELDALLNILHVPALPAGGLEANLHALTARMRASGLTIDLACEVALNAADPHRDSVTASALYRIVQEALTNAARHAPGSQVAVRVSSSGTGHELSVSNGPGRRTAGHQGSGYGLVGLGERVRDLGGDLSAAPTPDGAFHLQARIPFRTEVRR